MLIFKKTRGKRYDISLRQLQSTLVSRFRCRRSRPIGDDYVLLRCETRAIVRSTRKLKFRGGVVEKRLIFRARPSAGTRKIVLGAKR